MNTLTMTPQKQAGVIRKKYVRSALQELRHAGYAVIVGQPSELRGVNPRRVEDRSVELGHEVIECLA